jgi:hypothetical protein
MEGLTSKHPGKKMEGDRAVNQKQKQKISCTAARFREEGNARLAAETASSRSPNREASPTQGKQSCANPTILTMRHNPNVGSDFYSCNFFDVIRNYSNKCL